jgi:hypothetical protein
VLAAGSASSFPHIAVDTEPVAMSRSRLIALGLSAGVALGLVAGMAVTDRPEAPVTTPGSGPAAVPAAREPTTAEPPSSPFAGRAAITQTGAS